MIDSNKKVLLHLSLIPNVGPGTIINKLLRGLFLQKFPDLLHAGLMEIIDIQEQLDLNVFYTYSVNDLIKKCWLTERSAIDIKNGLANISLLIAEQILINQNEVTICSIFESTYPEILKQINLPPIILYYKGVPLEAQAKRFSIVGSRKADAYSQQVISSVTPTLVKHGWQIVSGGAEGVDTMAHRATMEAGGRTLVIMGSGFLHPYPPSNKDFFKELENNGGTIISSFSLNTPPDKSTFPARNRIIAGLAQGCLVVRAAARSGALITAQFALDQGRLIFAVPGSIYDDLSVGCHELIKQGAKLVNTASDILEDFNENTTQQTFIPAIFKKTEITQAPNPILQHMSTSCTVDELSNKTGLSLDDLFDTLFALQLEGQVKQNFAGQWERT